MSTDALQLGPSWPDDPHETHRLRCCEAPEQILRRCPGCVLLWAVCTRCDRVWSWQGYRFVQAMVRTPRTCPGCDRTMPARYVEQLAVTQRRGLPPLLSPWLPEVPGDHDVDRCGRSAIKYVDLKGDPLQGEHPCITRVTLSRSRRSVYWRGHRYRVVGSGYKYNHVHARTRRVAWISGPHRDGLDALYPATVLVDEEVRADYWTHVRGQPQRVHEDRFRSPGRYTKRGRGTKER